MSMRVVSVVSAYLLFSLIPGPPPSYGLPQPPGEEAEGTLPIDEIVVFDESAAQAKVSQILGSLAIPKSQTVSGVVRLEEGPRAVVFVRHNLQWVDFVQKVGLDIPTSGIKAYAPEELSAKLQSRIRPDLLARPVITQERANEELRSCHPALVAAPVAPRPPFFNNPTGFLWDPDKDYLALEANAIIDADANRCARGIIDLRTADVICLRDIACVVG